jgi:FeS assembly protein IscX
MSPGEKLPSTNPELPNREEVWPALFWEDTYAIVQALIEEHPGINLEDVSLGLIYSWTVALPGFNDDRELANEEILAAIYQEWYEEVNPI